MLNSNEIGIGILPRTVFGLDVRIFTRYKCEECGQLGRSPRALFKKCQITIA